MHDGLISVWERNLHFICSAAMISYLISVAFAGYVAYVSEPGSTLFSWHPTLMSLAFMVLVAQAIHALSPGALSAGTRRTRVTFHWLLVGGAVVSALLGFAAIYFTKEKFKKPHLTTPHGQLGCVVIVYLLVQTCAGLNVLYPAMATKVVPFGLLRRMHGISGVFLFLLVTLVLLGGVNSEWFKERVPFNIWCVCVAAPVLQFGLILKKVLLSGRPEVKDSAKKES